MKPRSLGVRLIALALTLCLTAPGWLAARVQPSHGFNMFSAQEEAQAGQQAAQQAQKQLPMLPDSNPVTKYVQSLGAQLAAYAPGEKWPYSFHVVNQKEINAFALPGGPLFVNLGTIQAADNEAELAGVIAHEISHVVQRHGTRAASKQMAAQLPLAVLGGLMGRGALSQMAQLGLSFGIGSYFLKNSRQAEKEADLLGAGIMYDAGYDPRQMASFFRKIQAEGGARAPEFFSDHPDPGNRFEYVSREANTLPAKRYRADSGDFQSVKNVVAGMKPLTAQQIAAQQKTQGTGEATGGNVTPSASWKTLEHDVFRISYPENWRVYGDQTSAVTIAPEGGISQNAVAYGAIVSVYQPENAGAGLDTNTHELIATLKQSNPDLRQIGRDEDIRVNGVLGKSTDLIGSSPIKDAQGSATHERDWLVTFPRRDGSLLYVVFISPDRDFGQLRPTFEQMLKSMRAK
ncbi:MAG: M48 family metalloprotease [Acidobacteriales bacterium]|nr:M48 family metalloprotease [Terriglobales bacterium]